MVFATLEDVEREIAIYRDERDYPPDLEEFETVPAPVPTLEQFTNASSMPKNLISAVVRQIGGWNNFKSAYSDVIRGGADAGWNGFITMADTKKFAMSNRGSILLWLDSVAIVRQTAVVILVGGLDYIRGAHLDDVAKTLYGDKRNASADVANAIAWMALCGVCVEYDRIVNNQLALKRNRR